MNAWFERLREAALAELGPGADLGAALTLSPEDARALLDLARDAAHGSGARQFAPLATFLVGRLVAARNADPSERARLIAVMARAVAAAGPAGESGPAL